MNLLSNVVAVWNSAASIELVLMLPLVVAQQRRAFPSFDPGFKALLDGATKPYSWDAVRIKLLSPRQRQQSEVDENAWGVFARFSELAASQNLQQITYHFENRADAGALSGIDRWGRDIFGREMAARFAGRGMNAQIPPDSMIKAYPQMVRTAGRLKPLD